MQINGSLIQEHNIQFIEEHTRSLDRCRDQLKELGIDSDDVVNQISSLGLSIPDHAVGNLNTPNTTGIGEAKTLDEKVEDIALLKQLNQNIDSILLTIPRNNKTRFDQAKKKIDQSDLRLSGLTYNPFSAESSKRSRSQDTAHTQRVLEVCSQLCCPSIIIRISQVRVTQNLKEVLQDMVTDIQGLLQQQHGQAHITLDYQPALPNNTNPSFGWEAAFVLTSKMENNVRSILNWHTNEEMDGLLHHLKILLIEDKLESVSLHGSTAKVTPSLKQDFHLFEMMAEMMLQKRVGHGVFPDFILNPGQETKMDPLEDVLLLSEQLLSAYTRALLIDYDSLIEDQLNKNRKEIALKMEQIYAMDISPLVREANIRKGGCHYPLVAFRKYKVREQLYLKREKIRMPDM